MVTERGLVGNFTLRNSAIWNCGLDNLQTVVLEVKVEMALPDPASLDPVRVDVLQKVGLEMQNLK